MSTSMAVAGLIALGVILALAIWSWAT